MTNERLFYELNEETCTIDGNTMTIVLPADKQSNTGVDFFFNAEFAATRSFKMKSVMISPAPLMCFWNWMCSPAGAPVYEQTLDNPIDISKYQVSGISGGFGFSGYAIADADITITITLDAE